MIKRSLILILFLIPVLLKAQDTTICHSRAREILEDCLKGNYTHAAGYFDQELLYRFDAGKLSQTWDLIEERVGKITRGGEPVSELHDTTLAVYQLCKFTNKDLDLKLVFNKQNKVIGFFFVPPGSLYSYKPPSWVAAGTVKERDVIVPCADLRLKGKLTMPVSGTKFPVVILIQGSGPQDMDESVGPNRPFADIANSLAAYGIAVLRYEKRTKAYLAEMLTMASAITPKEETVDDVIYAINSLDTISEIDHSKIILIGHSLGGMLAPRIATKDKRVKGIVMLAANARPLQDLIIEQIKYLAEAEDDTVFVRKHVADMQERIDRVNSGAYSDTTDTSLLPLGLGPGYWKYLASYNQVKEAQDLKIPIMIVQGERDYQVTMKDYSIWKQSLKSRPSTTFKSYPGLNHLFLSGTMPSKPDEYNIKGSFDKQVTDDIAEWIKANIH